MTLCPRDVTECNAPVTWQRVLQATAVHRNSMRFLSLSLSLSPSSFVPLLPPPLFPLSLSLALALPFPLLPRFAPFSEVCFRAYESRNPADRCTCQKRPRDRPSEMSNVHKRATRRETFTWFTPDDPNCAPPYDRGQSRSGGMKDETGYFRGVQASRCAFKWTRPRGSVEDSSSTALREEFLLLVSTIAKQEGLPIFLGPLETLNPTFRI